MVTREEIYKRAGYGGSVGFGSRPAIVIVDWQRQHTDLRSKVAGGYEAQCLQTRKLTDAAREKNIPVIYSRCIYKKDNVDLGLWGEKVPILKTITADNWDTGLDYNLDIRPDDPIVDKHWPSAFFGTHVPSMLIAMHIDTVIVLGCTVGGCVYATVADSCSYGFRTIVPTDGVGDRTKETFDSFMWVMEQQYADISSVDQCIAYFQTLEPLSFDFIGREAAK